MRLRILLEDLKTKEDQAMSEGHTRGPKYDVVWYWKDSKWHEADPEVYEEYKSVYDLVQDIRKLGFIAKPGLRSIGAPEGAP